MTNKNTFFESMTLIGLLDKQLVLIFSRKEPIDYQGFVSKENYKAK